MSRALWALLGVAACTPGGVDSAVKERARTLSQSVDGARLFSDVETLATQHGTDARVDCAALNTRAETWCNLSNTAARGLLLQRFRSLGLEPVEEPEARHPATSNVVVELRGTSRPDEVVLLGAHFDAFFMGADDNSSGVAVMLEVARLLAQRPLARTVRFVGFDLEEIGLVGSTRHVEVATRPIAAVVLDCVGYSDLRPGSQVSLPGFPSPPAGDFLAVIGNEVSRPQLEQVVDVASAQVGVPQLQAILAPGRGAGPLSGNLMRSDHAPFWLAGERALFFTDTANFRNPNYHTAKDTPDTLNRAFLEGAARATVMAIVTLGDTP